MDVFFIQTIVAELTRRLGGSRVDKIYQPGAETIVFNLWTGREKLRLAGSFHPDRPGLFLIGSSPLNPPAPHRFAQLLRARLARMLAVEQVPGERAVEMKFAGRDQHPYRLVAEFLGRSANLILVDEGGFIVDCLKRRNADSWGRTVKPGQLYQTPGRPQDRHPLEEFLPVPSEASTGERAFRSWLQATLLPMSPAAAHALSSRMGSGADPEDLLAQFRQAYVQGTLRPVLLQVGNRKLLTALPAAFLEPDRTGSLSSPSLVAETYFLERPGGVVGDRNRRQLEAAVQKRVRRLEERFRKLEQDRDRQSQWRKEGKWGELILANLYRLRRGMNEAVVEDLFEEPMKMVNIPLDQALTPQENAVRYLRRKARAERGRRHVDERLESTRGEIAWLNTVAFSLEEANHPEELQQIELELTTQGVFGGNSRAPARKPAPPSVPRLNQTRSPEGLVLFWGNNNRGNDYLYRHVLDAEDLWFHAHGMPGAHLVLKVEKGRAVPEAEILFAAGIAGGYSRGRSDSRVEVMVARGKDVRKPKGAPPGMVTVSSYRTVRVPPVRREPEPD